MAPPRRRREVLRLQPAYITILGRGAACRRGIPRGRPHARPVATTFSRPLEALPTEMQRVLVVQERQCDLSHLTGLTSELHDILRKESSNSLGSLIVMRAHRIGLDIMPPCAWMSLLGHSLPPILQNDGIDIVAAHQAMPCGDMRSGFTHIRVIGFSVSLMAKRMRRKHVCHAPCARHGRSSLLTGGVAPARYRSMRAILMMAARPHRPFRSRSTSTIRSRSTSAAIRTRLVFRLIARSFCYIFHQNMNICTTPRERMSSTKCNHTSLGGVIGR